MLRRYTLSIGLSPVREGRAYRERAPLPRRSRKKQNTIFRMKKRIMILKNQRRLKGDVPWHTPIHFLYRVTASIHPCPCPRTVVERPCLPFVRIEGLVWRRNFGTYLSWRESRKCGRVSVACFPISPHPHILPEMPCCLLRSVCRCSGCSLVVHS